MTDDIQTIEAEVEEIVENLPARREEVGAVNLFGDASPAEVLARASAIATPLARVIDEQQLYKIISGKKHVKVEGWTLLGSMLGVFPTVEWTRPVANGWEARVVAKTLDGREVGSSEAMCTRDETGSGNRWKSADEYAIRSMAQTRATSKALRLPLGFVMTLAGYEATPSEEMVEATSEPPASGSHLTEPGKYLPPGFPAGRDLADRIGKCLNAVDPGVDWSEVWGEACVLLLGARAPDLERERQIEAWTRLANVAERLAPYTDSVPAVTDEEIAQAFAACFEGSMPTVVRHQVEEPSDA